MSARGIVLAIGLWPGLAAHTVADEDADRACALLVEAARFHRLVATDPRGEYVCERQDEAHERFVFALRWRGEGLPAMGSNLVGYYLVDAASGDIHAWDLGENRRGEPLAAPSADAPHGASACGIGIKLPRDAEQPDGVARRDGAAPIGVGAQSSGDCR